VVRLKQLRLRHYAQTHLDRYVWSRFLRVLAQEIAADDVFGMAAEMAYRFLFAVFPFLLLLITVLGFAGDALGVDDLFAQLMRQVRPFLPGDVSEAIEQYASHLLSSRSPGFLTVGLLGTLWGAATGVGTLIKGLNRSYDVEAVRPLWRRQLLSMVITLFLPPVALAMLLLGLLSQTLLAWLGLSAGAAGLITFARWPILIGALWLGLSLLYQVLPNRRHAYRWSLLGGALGTFGWLALTNGFSLYIANFGSYNSTYGSFGAAIVFLLWLYLAGVVVLVAAEISALIEPRQRAAWWERPPTESATTRRVAQDAGTM
jgi:membrane protein